MEREDFLVRQMDEFREKAKALQNILSSKDIKSKELKAAVVDQEAKLKELEKVVSYQRRQSDQMMEEVDRQAEIVSEGVKNDIELLVRKIDDRMEVLTSACSEEIANLEEGRNKHFDELKRLLEELKQTQAELGKHIPAKLESMQKEIEEKVHTESVTCYRNIQTLFEESSHNTTSLKDEVSAVSAGRKFGVLSFVFSLLSFLTVGGFFIFYVLGNFYF